MIAQRFNCVLAATTIALVLITNAKGANREIYRGEPFGEALYDLVLSGATVISHRLVTASPMKRTDAFKLRDGRVLIISASTDRLNDPYSITKLSAISSDGDKKKIETILKLTLQSLAEPRP